MEKYYTSERHTQILIALLKFHGVRKIVASPGTTNICLVGSLQQDPFFEIYSSVDERSAAYIACGLARESGEPVALSCTGATASRNYPSGLTEAYYSNLPVLAITSTQHPGRVGQLMDQVIDRSDPMNDIAKKSILVRIVHTEEEEWATGVAINDALLELVRDGGGPVHINLETTYSPDFSVCKLPYVKGIRRYMPQDDVPSLEGKRILVKVGIHSRWTAELTEYVDKFCERYDAAVACESTSNYCGKYGVYPSLLAEQDVAASPYLTPDIMIHMGNEPKYIGGGYFPKEVWRVHPDGEVRDAYCKLTSVFEMPELTFFKKFVDGFTARENAGDFHKDFQKVCEVLDSCIPELPFSIPWITRNTRDRFPEGCVLHLCGPQTLLAWNMVGMAHDKKAEVYGSEETDGLASITYGELLANPERISVTVTENYNFLHDMILLRQEGISPMDVRIMVINHGQKEGLGHSVQGMGFGYMKASNKDDYAAMIDSFLSKEKKENPLVFEVFIKLKDGQDAIDCLRSLDLTRIGLSGKRDRTDGEKKATGLLKRIMGK